MGTTPACLPCLVRGNMIHYPPSRFVVSEGKYMQEIMRESSQMPQPKLEMPTELDYVFLRNWSDATEAVIGLMERTEEPSLAHHDHIKFVEVLMHRINPDGSVDRGDHTTNLIAAEDISVLSPEKRGQACDELANSLFSWARSASRDPQNREAVNWAEGCAAQQVSRYRYEPEFRRQAAEIADQAEFLGLVGVACSAEWPNMYSRRRGLSEWARLRGNRSLSCR